MGAGVLWRFRYSTLAQINIYIEIADCKENKISCQGKEGWSKSVNHTVKDMATLQAISHSL